MLLTNDDVLKIAEKVLRAKVLPALSDREARVVLDHVLQGLDVKLRNTLGQYERRTILSEACLLILEMRELGALAKEHDDERPLATIDEATAALDEGARALLAMALDARGDSDPAIVGLLERVAKWEGHAFADRASSQAAQTDPDEKANGSLTREKLDAIMRSVPEVGAEARIVEFETLSGGLTKEIYRFTLEQGGRIDELIARKDGSSPVLSFGAYAIPSEFRLHQCLFDIGMPVAEPLWCFEQEAGINGAFYVMRAVDGDVAGTPDRIFGEIPRAMLKDLATNLGRLHSAPLDTFDDYIRYKGLERVYSSNTTGWVREQVAGWHDNWLSFQRRPSPSEAHMILWLTNNVPQRSTKPSLVHSDCGFHNIVRKDDRIVAILDWEAAHFGNPAEDLAYIHDLVVGVMSWDDFIAHYREHGGADVGLEEVLYFKVFLAFRNTCAVNKSACRFMDGFYDERLLPLGLQYFPFFRTAALNAIAEFEANKG